MEISIDDFRIKALHYLKDSDNNHFRDYMDEMDNKYKSLKSTLLQKMEGTDFNEFYDQMPEQFDRLYTNDGKGNFSRALNALPPMYDNAIIFFFLSIRNKKLKSKFLFQKFFIIFI